MKKSLGWSHDGVWPGLRHDVGGARTFVEGHLREHQLTNLSDDVRLVVSELATNVVLHAKTPFDVTLERRDGSVRLSVHDGSHEPPVRQQSSPLVVGGCGLLLIEQCATTWGVTAEDDGKSVWATFALLDGP